MLYMKKVLQPDINQIKQQRHSGDIASHHSLKTKLLACSAAKDVCSKFLRLLRNPRANPRKAESSIMRMTNHTWASTKASPQVPRISQHNATEAAGALEAPNGEAPELKHRAPTQSKREVWVWSFSLGFKARQSAAHMSEAFMSLHYILDFQILLMLFQSLLL